VTANAVGTATITATAAGDTSKKATCVVTVTAIQVSGITVSPTTVSIQNGETYTLTATIAPSNAANQGVTWSSSNSAVVSVSDSGVVTAHVIGTATITATAAGDTNKKATCVVTVTGSGGSTEPEPPITDPTSKLSLTLNETCLSFIERDTAAIEWFSGNEKVLSIDKASGRVSYHHITGTAIIEGKQLVGGVLVTVYRTEVRVQYSFWQLLAAIFLLGFLWL
jgi:hypothetical protein